MQSAIYNAYFGFAENPFNISPDPEFLYRSPQHEEALANLIYGVRGRKGFIVLTGEVGTGKTTMLECLRDYLESQRTEFAFIFNSRLTPDQFFEMMAFDFELQCDRKSKTEVLFALNALLIAQAERGRTSVLIVDEAHNLEWEVLEEIRLLGNLENRQGKLLQIILAGQPELDRKLDAPNLRQLKQRIVLRCGLNPLTPDESAAYIETRLARVGIKGGDTRGQRGGHVRGSQRLVAAVRGGDHQAKGRVGGQAAGSRLVWRGTRTWRGQRDVGTRVSERRELTGARGRTRGDDSRVGGRVVDRAGGGAVIAGQRHEDDIVREREAHRRPLGRAAARGGIAAWRRFQGGRVKGEGDDGSTVANRVPDARRDGGGQVPRHGRVRVQRVVVFKGHLNRKDLGAGGDARDALGAAGAVPVPGDEASHRRALRTPVRAALRASRLAEVGPLGHAAGQVLLPGVDPGREHRDGHAPAGLRRRPQRGRDVQRAQPPLAGAGNGRGRRGGSGQRGSHRGGRRCQNWQQAPQQTSHVGHAYSRSDPKGNTRHVATCRKIVPNVVMRSCDSGMCRPLTIS